MEALVFQFVNYVLAKNVVLVYIIFLFSAFIQMIFPPHPGDVLLVFQGYLTSVSTSFNVIPIFIIAIAGTFASSVVVYKFGYNKGDRVFEYGLVRKYVSDKHKESARQLFEKYGTLAILASKFIPGTSAVMLLFAGIFKLKLRVVYLPIIISIIIHDIICIALGIFLGSNMNYVKKIFSTYNGIVIAVVIVAVLGYTVRKFIVNRRAKKSINEEIK